MINVFGLNNIFLYRIVSVGQPLAIVGFYQVSCGLASGFMLHKRINDRQHFLSIFFDFYNFYL